VNTNAGLKCAARGSLKVQVAKNTQKSPSVHHCTNLSCYTFVTKACIDNLNRKSLVHSNISSKRLTH